MIRLAVWLSIAVGAASALWMLALYLGGYPQPFAHERLGLIPLIAGLGAAVLSARRRGRLSRPAAGLATVLLVLWALFLRVLN